MATDFVTQLLRKVIRDHSTLDMSKGQQRFTMRTSEVSTMVAFWRDRESTLTAADIAAIENLRNSSQTIDLYLYNKRAPGTGNTRVRRGTGNSEIATVAPTFFAPIEEGLDMSFVNQAIRQYGSEGADKRQIIERAYSDHLSKELPQIFRNIYTRANAQYLAFLESQKWALTGTADAGTIYTDFTNDQKNIPNADPITSIIQNMQIEAQQNNFLQLGRPLLLHSPRFTQIVNEYLARGSANEQNVVQFLNWFDALSDNAIIDLAGAPDDVATAYLIAAGGLAGYQRAFPWDAHPDAEGGVLRTGEDTWRRFTIGGEDTGIFTGLPQLTLELKTFSGFEDTSATYTIDESNIDIVNNWSFVVQLGGLVAYDPDANVSPIIRYARNGA
jgi:hypothetical protein